MTHAEAYSRARERVARLSALPTFDTRLLKAVGDEDADQQFRLLTDLLHSDPALAARTMKVANSAFYGGVRSIASIDRAMTVLGSMAVIGIAMAASLDGSIRGLGPEHAVLLAELRRHCLATAVAARRLVQRSSIELGGAESAFVLGLLHDIGYLVELQLQHDAQMPFARPAPAAVNDAGVVDAAEPSHDLLGAALLEQWQLPAELAEAVRTHHLPFGAAEQGPLAQMLALANQCALADPLPFGGETALDVATLPLASFGLDAEAWPEFAAQCLEEAAALGGLLK
jgi:putative nucleotidyltransferase with HDIG domain